MAEPIPIDNDIGNELDSLVTWQYDNAPHLCGIIDMFKEFFSKAVTEPANNVLKLANLPELDLDWALAIWGNLLGLPRPQLLYGGSYHLMSRDKYRNLLLARMRLLGGSASTKEYVDYVSAVFGGNAKFVDNFDMTVSVTMDASVADTDPEYFALHGQYLDKVMSVLPTGVCMAGDYSFNLFSIAKAFNQKQEDVITNFDPNNGGCLKA